MIPDSFLEELKQRCDIESLISSYVLLKRAGRNLKGLCPFHSEKTPSFVVYPESQSFYCFGCGAGGDAISFIMRAENLEYIEAVKFLAEKAGLPMPENTAEDRTGKRRMRILEMNREAARFFHQCLVKGEDRRGLEYLANRGMDKKMIIRFGLGYAPDSWNALRDHLQQKGYSWEEMLDAALVIKGRNGSVYDTFRGRVIFPIIDLRGNVIGFGGRVMDGSEPKYLNSPESMIFNKRKNLFALNVAKKTKMEMLVLTEGYMDTISMHQYGFDCAVASLGTSLTQEQAGMLSKYTKQMVLCYDGDQAGQNAAKRAIGILEKTGITVKVLRMQGAKDPDEFLKKYGAERFKKLLGMSENQAVYQLESIRRKYDLGTDDGKVEFLKEAAAFIATMDSSVEREVYSGRAAEMAGIEARAMQLEVERAFKRRINARKKREERQNLRPAEQIQPTASGLKYDNVRSAVAEEGILSQILLEPALLDLTKSLKPEQFSAPLLGRVYAWMEKRWQEGESVSIPAMGGDFTPEEVSHITRISQKQERIVSEKALGDYIGVIQSEAAKRGSKDLMAALHRRREQNGYGG